MLVENRTVGISPAVALAQSFQGCARYANVALEIFPGKDVCVSSSDFLKSVYESRGHSTCWQLGRF